MEIEFGKRGQEIDAVATGKRIQELRKQKGLRVVDISDYMGFYEPQAVYKWMTGTSLPCIDNLVILADLYRCKVEDMLVRIEF